MGRSSSPPLLFFSIITLSSCGAAVVPTANHEFNFRGCIDSSPTADTGVNGSNMEKRYEMYTYRSFHVHKGPH